MKYATGIDFRTSEIIETLGRSAVPVRGEALAPSEKARQPTLQSNALLDATELKALGL